MAHEGANHHDSKLLAATLDSIPKKRPKPSEQCPQGLCLDRGYDYDSARELATERGFTPHIRTRGEEIKLKLRTPGWRARRWIIEACHSWLNRNRALLTRWSKKDQNHLALLQLASGLIAFKKAHLATLTATQPAQALNPLRRTGRITGARRVARRTERRPMRRFAHMNKTLAAAAVVGSLLVLVACAGFALAFGVSQAGASKTKRTTSTATTGTTGTTTGTTTSSTPLSDSGSANCASDGGTLISNVCVLGDAPLPVRRTSWWM